MENRLTQGNMAPLEHLNNIYRTKSTLIIYSCRAWLPRWVRSSFASTSVMLMNIKGQGISSVGAFISCPPVWGIWQDFKPAEQLQPPQAAQKKQLDKACDFSTVCFGFFSGHWLLQVGSHQLISFQWDLRHLDTSINNAETLQKVTRIHVTSWSTGFLHSAEETILPTPRG